MGFPESGMGCRGGGKIKGTEGGEGGGEKSRDGDPRCFPKEMEESDVEELYSSGERRWSGTEKVLGSIFNARSDSSSSKGSCSHGP